jgi:thiamine transport system substrate-binding protein
MNGSLTNLQILSQRKLTENNSITIYTYESLMADPFYDIVGNFSFISEIPSDNIHIERFSDANVLVSKIVEEKDNPVADVVIGIDNALKHLFNLTDVLEKYDSPALINIDQNLIDNLDASGYLIPYDFGAIALYYKNQIINETTHPILNNLTFEDLLASDLPSKIIIENPKISSTGLGFLLWTIAYYGDPIRNIPGLLGQDWHNFWDDTGTRFNITKSWGDAFTVFLDDTANKPLMVSYSTSPAYSSCLYNDNSTSAVVTSKDGSFNAWLQIEGIGLIKNSPNSETGKKFIDWFLSTELQSEIPTTQWMYPANNKAQIPECFSQSALNPSNITRLNNYLNPSSLNYYLNFWLDEWEQSVVKPSLSAFDLTIVIIVIPTLGLIVILRKNRSQK